MPGIKSSFWIGFQVFFSLLTLFNSLSFAQMGSDYPELKPRKVIIGIVRDGNSDHFDRLSEQVIKELGALTGMDFEVYFKQVPAFNAQWQIPRIRKALLNALRDREVNIVFTGGVLTTEMATQSSLKLNKPVVGGSLLDADIVKLPYDENGYSTKHNLNFVATSNRIVNDLEAFHKLVPFTTLHVLVDSKLLEGLKDLDEEMASMEKQFNFTIRLVPMGEQADEVLNRLDNSTEAVYLTPPFRMPDAEQEKLINGFKTKKLPSFSLMGRKDVERGILAGLAPELMERMARRIAFNLQQVMLGVPPEELPTYMPLEEQLTLNAETAAQIGYYPSFETMMTADILNEDAAEMGESLTLERAMQIAMTNNIDLAIQSDQVESTRQDMNKAGTFMLPQVYGNVEYSQIDADRAKASFGSQPENRTTIGLTARQMIFDDALISGYRAARRVYGGSLFSEDATRLDVMALAAKRYIEYLAARARVRIERDNLRLTQDNLELSRVRYQVGMSGPEEVYRWETQQARQKALLLEAKSAQEQARTALNQTLGVDQRIRWKPVDIELADDDSYFLDNRVRLIMDDMAELEQFRQFSVLFALENDPDIKAVEEKEEAQEIRLAQLKRRFILPTINTSFQFDHELDKRTVGDISSGGSSDFGDISLDFSSSADKNDWVWGISVSLPLFEGGGRFVDVAKAKADLSQFENTKFRLRQLVDQRVRSAIYSMESSHPNIRLTRLSLESARKNLEVVQDKYARGTVPIIDLLDAQNQVFVSELAAALAMYTYLGDLMEYQRSISWFEMTKTEEEKEEWLSRLKAHMEKPGTEANAPPHSLDQ